MKGVLCYFVIVRRKRFAVVIVVVIFVFGVWLWTIHNEQGHGGSRTQNEAGV